MKTHKQKLQAVTEDIRSKLPRLREISKGDFIKGNLIIGLSLDVYLVYSYVKEKVYEVPISKMSEIFEGKEPMLNDVLEWLGCKSPFRIESLVVGGTLRISVHALLVLEWDLSKLYLKDQSEELITFLHVLL